MISMKFYDILFSNLEILKGYVMKGRILATIVLCIATAITSIAAYAAGINPPVGNVAGAFASIAVLIIVSKIIKVSDELFYSGLYSFNLCVYGLTFRVSYKLVQVIWPL